MGAGLPLRVESLASWFRSPQEQESLCLLSKAPEPSLLFSKYPVQCVWWSRCWTGS